MSYGTYQAIDAFLGQRHMTLESFFKWLALEDMQALQTQESLPLCYRLQTSTYVGADLVECLVTQVGFGFRQDVGTGIDRAGEAKLGSEKVRTRRWGCFHQSRTDWFTLLLIKSKGDFSEIRLGAWNLKFCFQM